MENSGRRYFSTPPSNHSIRSFIASLLSLLHNALSQTSKTQLKSEPKVKENKKTEILGQTTRRLNHHLAGRRTHPQRRNPSHQHLHLLPLHSRPTRPTIRIHQPAPPMPSHHKARLSRILPGRGSGSGSGSKHGRPRPREPSETRSSTGPAPS